MNFSHLTSAECTDTGRKRSHNEDAVLRLPAQGLYCVADGMGGMYGGEIASKAVVDGLRRSFETLPTDGVKPGLLERAVIVGHSINQSSAWIKNYGEERGASGAGTTAVVFIFDPANPASAVVLHAGDSRLYRWRRKRLEQITRDHSVAAAAGLKNEKSLPHMFRGVVTRAVGLEREVKLEEAPVDVEADDLYVICSDGLTRMVTDAAIADTIASAASGDLETLAKALVAAANEAGGEDNISVIAIRVGVAQPVPAEVSRHTEALPVPSAAKPSEPETADRLSDPAHLSGVTPAHEGETPTPDTADFQASDGTTGGDTSRTHQRPVPVPGGEVTSSRARLAGGAFGLAILVIGGMLLTREKPDPGDATAASAHDLSTTAVTPSASASESPLVEPPPAAPGPDPAPAQVVERLPEPVQDSGPADLATARASVKVDVLEALLSGRWGALEVQLAALQGRFPALGQGVPEWTIFEAWRKEWKKVEFAAPPAAQLYAALRDAALPVLVATGVDAAELAVPNWTGQPAADADIYCAAAYVLSRRIAESLAAYAAARDAELRSYENGLMVVAVRLQTGLALTNGTPQEALAKWKSIVATLREGGEHAAVARYPPAPTLFGDVAAGLAANDAGKDQFFDRLVDLIKAWGYANRAQLAAQDATPRAREAFALYVRIANMRRASPDARNWRAKGGEQAVLDFFRVAGDALPAKP